MKQFARIFMIMALAIFTVLPLMAMQDPPVVEPNFPAFWEFAFAFALSTFGGVLLTAVNHVVAGTFNWNYFWSDSLKPLMVSFGLGLVAALVQIFFPGLTFLVEKAVDGEVSLNYDVLLSTGAALAVLLKAVFKRSETQAKVASGG